MNFTQALSQGSTQAWLFIPSAILIGALHGLEPGHSKTMMAAFIIAVKGTITQAALLGLSAALSHSFVIWVLAALALRYGNQWNVEKTEPYFLIATGLIVAGMAIWTLWRIRKGHSHHHHDETQRITIDNGWLEIDIVEDGVPPRFKVSTDSNAIRLEWLRTIRPDGTGESYKVAQRGNHWESLETIPEPHEFRLEACVICPDGEIVGSAEFKEHHHDPGDNDDEDAHTREHAEQIKSRFDGREVTTPQIILFGLTGGLIPCPAALSILLICLQLKKFTLGFTMVAAFSIGLAITLVTVGVVAAWSLKKAAKHTGNLGRLAAKAPYLSSSLLIALGLFFLIRGIIGLI